MTMHTVLPCGHVFFKALSGVEMSGNDSTQICTNHFYCKLISFYAQTSHSIHSYRVGITSYTLHTVLIIIIISKLSPSVFLRIPQAHQYTGCSYNR